MIRIYQPDAEELIEIRTLNESRKNVLLIICDYGDGVIGVDADDIDLPEFSVYKEKIKLENKEIDGKVKAEKVVELDETKLFDEKKPK
jgi:hypothetical protein